MSDTDQKQPQDDGFRSRKFVKAAVACGLAWGALTVFMGLALTFPMVTQAAQDLAFDGPLYVGAVKWLVGFAVVGYGVVNVAEKRVLTK